MDGAEKSTCQEGSKTLCTKWRKHHNHLRAVLCWVEKAQPLNFAFARFLLQNFRQKWLAFAAFAGFCVLSSTFLFFFFLAQQKPEKIPCLAYSVLFRAIPWGGPWGGVQCSKTGLTKTHGFPCYSVPFRAIPCYSVQFRAVPCNSVLFRALPWRRNFEGLLALDHEKRGKLSDTGVSEGNRPFRL